MNKHHYSYTFTKIMVFIASSKDLVTAKTVRFWWAVRLAAVLWIFSQNNASGEIDV